jgi:hypothetical protein
MSVKTEPIKTTTSTTFTALKRPAEQDAPSPENNSLDNDEHYRSESPDIKRARLEPEPQSELMCKQETVAE